jgi:hypothetical protein
MNLKIVLVIILLVILFMPNNTTEAFDIGLNTTDETNFNNLKILVSNMIKLRMQDYVNNTKDLQEIADLYFSVVKDNTIKPEDRKSTFISRAQDVVMPSVSGNRTNPYNINNFTQTMEFVYWELRLNNIKPNSPLEIVKLGLLSDIIINSPEIKALFKPAGEVVKTIQALISKYTISSDVFDLTFDGVKELP